MSDALEELARAAIDCGFKLHRALGPGLLESVYEVCLFKSLSDRGLSVERQKRIAIRFNGLLIEDAFRADLLIEKSLLIELKSTEAHAPVHAKQVITYLRLLDLPLGLLMNFGAATFKDGVRRLVNNYRPPERDPPSRLCVFARATPLGISKWPTSLLCSGCAATFACPIMPR